MSFDMKVTFTASQDLKTGWILDENACGAPVDDPKLVGAAPPVHVAVALRNIRLFNNSLIGVPVRALSKSDPSSGAQACKSLLAERSHIPPKGAAQEEEYLRKINEDIAKGVASLSDCSFLNTTLYNMKKNGLGVMLQADTQLENGQPGSMITVVGKPDQSLGGILLTTSDGATITAGVFQKSGYLDFAEKFIQSEITETSK